MKATDRGSTARKATRALYGYSIGGILMIVLIVVLILILI